MGWVNVLIVVFSAILLITSDQLGLVQNFLDNITMDIGFPGFQNPIQQTTSILSAFINNFFKDRSVHQKNTVRIIFTYQNEEQSEI